MVAGYLNQKLDDVHPGGDRILNRYGEIFRDYALQNFSVLFKEVIFLKDWPTVAHPGIKYILEAQCVDLRSIEWSSFSWIPIAAQATVKIHIYDLNRSLLWEAEVVGMGIRDPDFDWEAVNAGRAYESALQDAMCKLIREIKKAEIWKE